MDCVRKRVDRNMARCVDDGAALSQEIQVLTPAGVCLEDVVGEDDVGDTVFRDIIHHVFGEIPSVDDMHFLERAKEVSRDGVAETILENQHFAAIASGCLNFGYLGISAHEGAVGAAATILEMTEELALARTILAHNPERRIDIVDGVCGRVGNIGGGVIDEIFGRAFDRYISGESIHRAHEATRDMLLKLSELRHMHLRHTA